MIVLALAITANLATLGFFKYLFPLIHFIDDTLGLHAQFTGVILPLGISFFTFTQIALPGRLVTGNGRAAGFDQLRAICDILSALDRRTDFASSGNHAAVRQGPRFWNKLADIALGLSWFTLGLGKKVLLADRFAPYADAAFAHTGSLTMTAAWIGVLNYALQLYFDFSGYSDMAIGLARMFSIEFPFNFDSPYRATSIIDFWSRWHMTLTRYLTLYLYNPFALWANRRRAALGKPNSRKALRTAGGFGSLVAFPTITTMFLAGIWHGAGLQFIIFGILHGLYLTINHAWRIFRQEGSVIVSRPCTAGSMRRADVSRGPDCSSIFSICVNTRCFGRSGRSHWPARMSALTRLSKQPPHAFLFLLALPVIWGFPNTQEILRQVRQYSSEYLWLEYTGDVAAKLGLGEQPRFAAHRRSLVHDRYEFLSVFPVLI